MTRELLLAGGIALLCLPLLSGSDAFGDKHEWLNEDLMVEQIAANVWRHVSYQELETFGRSAANGLVVMSAKSAALLDTPWTDAQTLELFEWASGLGAAIDTVVVTHSHPDCMGGLAAAHRQGAVSYSSATTADFARRDGNAVPQNTFTDSLMVTVGSRRLRLDSAGPGHTSDNIVVWIPDDLILFGGCLVRSGSAKSLGYTDEADIANWPRTIESLLERYNSARVVVPGHGDPGGLELLDRTLQLLRDN